MTTKKQKGTQRAIDFSDSIIEGLKLLPDDPQALQKREELFDSMKKTDIADTRLTQLTGEATRQREVVVKLERELLVGARGAASLLAIAEPEIADELPVGEIFEAGDGAVIAERVVALAHGKSVSDDSKAVGRLVQRLSHKVRKEGEQLKQVDASVIQATVAATTARWSLTATAKDAELYVRLHAPKGSAASKHVKKRYIRRAKKPAEESKQVVATPQSTGEPSNVTSIHAPVVAAPAAPGAPERQGPAVELVPAQPVSA